MPSPLAPAPKPAAPPSKPAPAPQIAQPPKPVTTDTLKAEMRYLGPKLGRRADLFYGASGNTKTTQLAWIAKYVHETTGKTCRMVTGDPGGYEPIQSTVDAGLIEPFVISQYRTNLYETLRKLTLGWWPEDANNLESVLQPPSRNGIDKIGGFFFESLYSWGDMLMHLHTTDLANIQVPRSDVEKSNIIKSGDFTQRFSSQTDYGKIQEAIAAFVRNSGMLPGLTVWTSVDIVAEEKTATGVVKRLDTGPDIIGQKATINCGPWFGNFIHLDTIEVKSERPDPLDPGKKIEVIEARPFLFLKTHIRPGQVHRWRAKTRAPMELHQEVPHYMEPRADKFYFFMDSLADKARKLQQTKQEVTNAR